MFYVGIDIAKKNHEAFIINANDKLINKSISFLNSQTGSSKLISLLEKYSIDVSNVVIDDGAADCAGPGRP